MRSLVLFLVSCDAFILFPKEYVVYKDESADPFQVSRDFSSNTPFSNYFAPYYSAYLQELQPQPYQEMVFEESTTVEPKIIKDVMGNPCVVQIQSEAYYIVLCAGNLDAPITTTTDNSVTYYTDELKSTTIPE